jgi:peptidoglycan hydrolase-like protein with peptidoglycan-binding domain
MTTRRRRFAARAATAAALVGLTAAVSLLPNAANASTSSQTLALGSQGDGVVCVQKGLKEFANQGYLTVDGIYGPQTRQAVINFQSFLNIQPIDGKVGKKTGDMIRYLYYKNPGGSQENLWFWLINCESTVPVSVDQPLQGP